MSSIFGTLFRISTWGESHGKAVGVVVDGCPSGLPLCVSDIQVELDRRRPGQSSISTPRKESDKVEILSGVFEGKTTGCPISLLVWNDDANSLAYDHLKNVYRPSHADYTFDAKFGFRDWRGGGRSSAREAIGRVAAGAIAQKYLAQKGIFCVSYVSQIYTLVTDCEPTEVLRSDVEATVVRCPDLDMSSAMIQAIEQARKEGDSLGGVITGVIHGVPAGLGEPVFDKLKADLGKAMLSIPAVLGFQVGSGFKGVLLKGSEHNDAFYHDGQRVRTRTNRSGGIQGGISNGEPIVFQVAFKPTATIFKEQDTVDRDGQAVKLAAKGRHDPCVLPRAVPIVDAMASLVIIDHLFIHNARKSSL